MIRSHRVIRHIGPIHQVKRQISFLEARGEIALIGDVIDAISGKDVHHAIQKDSLSLVKNHMKDDASKYNNVFFKQLVEESKSRVEVLQERLKSSLIQSYPPIAWAVLFGAVSGSLYGVGGGLWAVGIPAILGVGCVSQGLNKDNTRKKIQEHAKIQDFIRGFMSQPASISSEESKIKSFSNRPTIILSLPRQKGVAVERRDLPKKPEHSRTLTK